METISFPSLAALTYWINHEPVDQKERERLMLDGITNRTFFGSYFVCRVIKKFNK